MKLHFHSDCPYFGGSERMLINFFRSSEVMAQYKISFSFRDSDYYKMGLFRRLGNTHKVKLLPIKTYDPFSMRIIENLNNYFLINVFMGLIRKMLFYPLFILDILKIVRILIRIRPDIVHINNGGFPGALSSNAAVIAAKIVRVQVVLMVVNNLAIPVKGLQRHFERPIDFLVSKNVDMFVTGSRIAKEELDRVLKLPIENSIAIANGIDIPIPSEKIEQTRLRLNMVDAAKVYFGIVAILEERKGIIFAIQAIEILVKGGFSESLNIELLVEGSGSQQKYLQSYINQRNLSNFVRLIGTEMEVSNFITAVDVIVVPSIANEDFPNIVIEAMALGKPVVATRVGGIPEQFKDGHSGILVIPGNSKDLSEAFLRLHNDQDFRNYLGENAKNEYLLKYISYISVGEYINLYNHLLATRR